MRGLLESFDFFEKEIRPLLHKHCYKCHSTEAEKVKGGLLLDSRQGMGDRRRLRPGDCAWRCGR